MWKIRFLVIGLLCGISFSLSLIHISFRQEGARLFLGRPEGAEVPYTVELEVEGKPEAVRSQTTFWIPE